jgi:hypothetical protein
LVQFSPLKVPPRGAPTFSHLFEIVINYFSRY